MDERDCRCYLLISVRQKIFHIFNSQTCSATTTNITQCSATDVSLHAGMASLYSLVLVVSAWIWRIRNEREGETEKEGEETPSKHLIV